MKNNTNTKTKKLLKTLTHMHGVSGTEYSVAELVEVILGGLCDEVKRDPMGCVIGLIRGTAPKKKIMLEAHMDRVGFIINGIDGGGELRFAPVGGIDPRILPGMRVTITGKNDVTFPGVVAVPDIVGEKTPEIKDMRILTGLAKEEAEEKFEVGGRILYDAEFIELADGKLCAAAMDNRAGMTAMIKAAEELAADRPKDDVYFLFSTQEEIGLRGAFTGTFSIKPDIAIITDVTHGLTADSKDDTGVFPLGSGAVILRGPNVDHDMSLHLIELAEERGIKYDIEAAGGASGTTAMAIQTVGPGVCTLLISIPLRYMHTNVEVLDPSDIDRTAELMAAAVSEFSDMDTDNPIKSKLRIKSEGSGENEL